MTELPRTASEDLVAGTPPVRARDGIRIDAPTARVAADAHSPEAAVGATAVEDVCLAVHEQVALLAISLLVNHCQQMGHGSFWQGSAERDFDVLVERILCQAVCVEVACLHVLFHLGQEVYLEVGIQVCNPVRAYDKLLRDNKPLHGATPDLDVGQSLEARGRSRRHFDDELMAIGKLPHGPSHQCQLLGVLLPAECGEFFEFELAEEQSQELDKRGDGSSRHAPEGGPFLGLFSARHGAPPSRR